MPSLSIIIPTLNEEECLGLTLSYLSSLQPPPTEIIIVDGGSFKANVIYLWIGILWGLGVSSHVRGAFA